jgi:hypothetical protein
MVCLNFGCIILYFPKPSEGSWWSQSVGSQGSHHCLEVFKDLWRSFLCNSNMKVVQTGLLGLSFLETGNGVKSQDESNIQCKKRGPNQFLHPNWSLKQFQPPVLDMLYLCLHCCMFYLLDLKPSQNRVLQIFLNCYPVLWIGTQIFQLSGYSTIGNETGIRGSDQGDFTNNFHGLLATSGTTVGFGKPAL